MPLTIYQASAGSGKTFKLTEEYLMLLFRKPYAYKNVLAVTFTNKATGEMKQRILNELANLAHGRNSPYMDLLTNQFQKSESQIRTEASGILNKLLHDYARFTVETIDKFFQRILRSFVREINLQGTYAIELDQNRVLEDSIENLLLTIDGDEQLRNWLLAFANEQIEKGKSWNIKLAISQLASEIFNEKFQMLGARVSEKIKDKQFLKRYLGDLHAVMNRFETKMSKIGKNGLDIIKKYNLEIDDFQYKNSGVAGYLVKIAEKKDFDPKKRARNAVNIYENWYPKKSVRKNDIIAAFEDGLNESLSMAVDYYDKHFLDYFTAGAILRNIYTLGIITDIQHQVRALCEDENIFLLSDAGAFISQIIQGSDAPFMYEKVGNYYQHFMLDEFQDTSYIQWNNFKPLITNSLAGGFKNIVVGDVKQSIYRWRNSSWKILAQDVHSSMASFSPEKVTLDTNWRSATEIVTFNNTVFGLAADYLQDLFYAELPEYDDTGLKYGSLIKKAYDQAVQKISRDLNGVVDVRFFDNNDEPYSWIDDALETLVLNIKKLHTQGVPYREMAVLIRNQREGAKIASFLMNHNQAVVHDEIPFISSDALSLESSVVGMVIIRAFRYLLNPGDVFNLFELVYHFSQIKTNQATFNFHHYDREKLTGKLPNRFTEERNYLIHLPLTSIFEEIVQCFGLNQTSTEQAYVYAFADLIRTYAQTNNLSVSSFLDWWDQNGARQVIKTTGDQDAVSIVTIHKSKGLEYKAVIIPFCDWEIDHNSNQDNILWVTTDKKPFNMLELLPVRYSNGLTNTHFKEAYFEEKMQAYVDNLNLLYVAFTRAKQFLYVSLPHPEHVKRKDKTVARLLFDILSNSTITESNNLVVDFASHWNPKVNTFTLGTHSSEIKPAQPAREFSLSDYPSFSPHVSYNISYKSVEWLMEESESLSLQLIDEGKMMHRIFEQIITESDVDKAVEITAMEGVLAEIDVEALKQKIHKWINQPKINAWFQPKQNVKTEAAILLSDGKLRRPDRVIFTEKEVKVVDFKFGKVEKLADVSQMKTYIHLLRSMGYKSVKGYIWYAQMDVIREVESNR